MTGDEVTKTGPLEVTAGIVNKLGARVDISFKIQPMANYPTAALSTALDGGRTESAALPSQKKPKGQTVNTAKPASEETLAQEALPPTLSAMRAGQRRKENKASMDACNAFVAKHGVFGDGIRGFRPLFSHPPSPTLSPQ